MASPAASRPRSRRSPGHRRGGALVAVVGVIAASMAFSPATTAARAAVGAGSGPSWRIVRGAVLAPNNVLNGLAVVSQRLAWAAGAQGLSSDGKVPGRPVIERWIGSRWSAARLPSTWTGGLGPIAASSATNAWALGQESSGLKDHLLHWNGHAWQTSRYPGLQGTISGNLGLTAAPGGRAWLITTTG